MNIPIISVPGRAGTAFKFGIWYDNRFWTAATRTDPQGSNFQFWNMEKRFYLAPQTGLHGLWSATQHGLMRTSYQKDCGPRVSGPSGQVIGTGSVIYLDSLGGKHAIEANDESGSCVDPIGSYDFINSGPDTTGVGAFGTEDGITLADGTHLDSGGLPVSPNDPPNCTGPCPVTTANAISTETDSNGNIQQEFPSGLDTLGRSLVTQVQGPNTIEYIYKDSLGNSQTYTVGFQAIQILTSFNVVGSFGSVIHEGGTTRQVETSLTLPNGRSYTFSYDNYGSLISMGLPTGGVINYTWQNFSCGDSTFRYVASRTVIANGQQSPWTFNYALTPGAQCSTSGTAICTSQLSSNCTPPITVTVTDPLGNQSVYTVLEGNVTSANFYQGTVAAGIVLRQNNITYTDYNYPNGPPRIWLPTKTVTQLQNGKVSEKDLQYDTFSYPVTQCVDPTTCASFGTTTINKTTSRGNVTDTWDYDWGTANSGTHGPLLRQTHHDYLHDSVPAYAVANIISKILHSIVYDGAGNKAAETDYDFDGAMPTTTSNAQAPQHDYAHFSSSYNVRGNATAVKRWRNTDGALLATTLTYDDLGNIRSIKDPLNHQMSFDYSDSLANTGCAPPANSQAWVSQVTNPLSQHIQVIRYPCTGLVQAHKDQNDIDANGPGKTFTYDLMGRPTQMNLPDGGQVSTVYNDVPPTSETTSTKITSDPLNLVTGITKDGLGRTIQSQTISDPAGVDTVYTTYDLLGRTSTVSNPQRAVSSPTDGTTTSIYDALGRVTNVIHQDGSVSSTDYSQFPTVITTDPAGAVRQSRTDALGRLVEVDEPGSRYVPDQPATDATSGTGTVIISGTEQSQQVQIAPPHTLVGHNHDWRLRKTRTSQGLRHRRQLPHMG